MRVAAHEIFVFDLRKHPRKSIIFLLNLLKEDGFVKRGFTRLTRKQSGKQKKIEPDTLPLRDWFDLPRKQEGQGVFFRQNFGICFQYYNSIQREYCELHLLTKGGTSNHEDRGKDASNSSTLALDAAGARREDWIGKERSKSHSPI